jgi:hypothetical protein
VLAELLQVPVHLVQPLVQTDALVQGGDLLPFSSYII